MHGATEQSYSCSGNMTTIGMDTVAAPNVEADCANAVPSYGIAKSRTDSCMLCDNAKGAMLCKLFEHEKQSSKRFVYVRPSMLCIVSAKQCMPSAM